jgi:hypothetical protein
MAIRHVKPAGKRPLWKPRHKWNYSIKMDLKYIGHEDMDWIRLAPYRVY